MARKTGAKKESDPRPDSKKLQERLEGKVTGMMPAVDKARDVPAKPGKPQKKSDGKIQEKPKPVKAAAQKEKPKGKDAAEKKARTKEAPPREELPKESLSELASQREEIEALLSSIEDAYREATLPDTTYQEVKAQNERKLKDINRKMEMLQKEAGPSEEITEEEPALISAEPVRAVQAARTSPRTVQAPVPEKPGKAEALIKVLEEKIEERLKNVIAMASVEVTDKRIGKIDQRLEALEMTLKEVKRAADTVDGYEKQFSSMSADVEKTKARMDSVKESRNIIDEKMQRLTETFAEIRSIVYQREAASKDQEVLIDKLRETISHVDTARILREFTVRDEQLRDVNTRLERLERSNKMLSETMSRIKGLMTDIGSLENIMKASKLVGEKLERIQEIEEKIKAVSTRLDGIYVDMKKRLDEFNTYKVRQDKLSGMSEDMSKNFDELSRRLTDYATKSDLESLKDQMSVIRESMKKASEPKIPPEVRSLSDEKEQIETLLSTLEENLKNKDISQAEFDNAKQSNIKKLVEIEKKIQSYMKAPKPSVKSEEAGDEEEPGPVTGKHRKIMTLAKLRESYERGEISKRAYDKGKKLLLRK